MGAQPHRAACRRDLADQGLAHADEVDRRGVRRVKRRGAPHVRLDLTDLGPGDTPQARNPVGQCPALDLGQAGQLRVGTRDHQLAELAQADVVLGAELAQHAPAAHAQPRLQAPGRIVQTGVDDTAVVPALMGGDVIFLVEHGHLQARVADRQFPGHRQPDDAAAYHRRRQRPDHALQRTHPQAKTRRGPVAGHVILRNRGIASGSARTEEVTAAVISALRPPASGRTSETGGSRWARA